ncbi:MAG: hypothetical protein H3C31_11770 [Brumimicrobium sp.]|nr:hypothetical protein [Brumimicrobium sp.]MCO5268692.1 hypothetical protein [Brumimicrobium sp.]
MRNLKSILVLISIVSSVFIYGQCPDFTQIFSVNTKEGWSINSQSKKGYLKPGEAYEMVFILQPKIKYRIRVASGFGTKFSEEDVSFQVIGKETGTVEKDGQKTYVSQDVVLFDSENRGNDEPVFYSERTRRLSIKVRVSGETNSTLDSKCGLVLIEARRPNETGLQ